MLIKPMGFTLVELVMVTAIVSVLLALGIPSYQDFVGRAQVSDAVVIANSRKVDVESYITENGYFPQDESFQGFGGLKNGLYTQEVSVAVADTCSAAGVIEATIKHSGTSAEVSGKTFLLARDTVGNWRCSRGWENTLADLYLPAACRQSATTLSDPPDCPVFKNNNGHGNNADGVDSSNPGNANKQDGSGGYDDEKGKKA